MKKCFSYATLALVFLACLIGYGKYVFTWATILFEKILDCDFRWHDAPLLEFFFQIGIAVGLSWVVTVGLRNTFRKRPFLDGINWQKIFLVVGCLSLWWYLCKEVEALVPGIAAEESEDNPNLFLSWSRFGSLVLVYFVGKALWPKSWYWTCLKCNTVNPWEMRRCTGHKCTGFRWGEKMSKAEANDHLSRIPLALRWVEKLGKTAANGSQESHQQEGPCDPE